MDLILLFVLFIGFYSILVSLGLISYREKLIVANIELNDAQKLAVRTGEERDLFKTLLDSASNIIFIKKGNGEYFFVNRRFQKIFDISLSEINGKTDHQIFPKEYADVFQANDLEVLNTGRVMMFEEYARHDSTLHSYLVTKFPLINSKSEIFALGGIATDITVLKNTQRELHEANAFLDSVLDNIPSMIFIKEAKNLTFVKANAAFCEVLGCTPDELIGKNDFDLVPED